MTLDSAKLLLLGLVAAVALPIALSAGIVPRQPYMEVPADVEKCPK